MNDRAVSLFEQYELTITKTKKGRGAIIAETDKGMKVLTEYRGYREKTILLELLMNHIKEKGFPYIDCFVRNKEDEIISTDYDGKTYIVKDYLNGTECNVHDLAQCKWVTKELARLHECMSGFPLDNTVTVTKDSIRNEFVKHNTELKRVRSFIRKSSVKSDFELLFLKEYDCFYKQAEEAMAYLSESVCAFLCEKIATKATYCHGDCSHHNLLIDDNHVNIINFEKSKLDTQIRDLSLFLRKILEKNDWDSSFGIHIIDAYHNCLPLSKEEFAYLYARLLYPEKFTKIAGSYLNQRKSLPAKRQQEKLVALLNKEEKRTEFLEMYLNKYILRKI